MQTTAAPPLPASCAVLKELNKTLAAIRTDAPLSEVDKCQVFRALRANVSFTLDDVNKDCADPFCSSLLAAFHSDNSSTIRECAQDKHIFPIDCPKPPKDNSNTTVIVVAVCISVAVIATAVAIYYYCRHKKRTMANHSKQENYTTVVASPTVVLPLPSFTHDLNLYDLADFKVPFHEVKMIKPLAQGAFGEVWFGQYRGEYIAVKKLLSAMQSQEVQFFIWEIFLLSKITSPYVVAFRGVTWDVSPAGIMLLIEYMDGGDLLNALSCNASTKRLTWEDKLVAALDVAQGLVYLHSLDPIVIHRDLKSRNVMLDSSGRAKITDFGVARETNDATMTVGIGTYRWMAPEVLMSGHYSELADIYSFGVILSEISSEVIPYSDLTRDNRSLTDAAIISQVMEGKLRPSFDPRTPKWFVNLSLQCLSFEASNRPTAMKVAYELKTAIADLSKDVQAGFV
ncbi:unnamed protein product [Aphanomyces euteiches]